LKSALSVEWRHLASVTFVALAHNIALAAMSIIGFSDRHNRIFPFPFAAPGRVNPPAIRDAVSCARKRVEGDWLWQKEKLASTFLLSAAVPVWDLRLPKDCSQRGGAVTIVGRSSERPIRLVQARKKMLGLEEFFDRMAKRGEVWGTGSVKSAMASGRA
jgi:hypothetical protein